MPYLDLMKELAWEAGDIMRKNFGGRFQVYRKPDGSRVTDVDLEISRMVGEQLRERAPELLLYSEETTSKPAIEADRSYLIVDELDGTSYFIDGNPGFSHQSALFDGESGRLSIGLVYFPIDDLLLYGVRGQGVWMEQNGEARQLPSPPMPDFADLHYAHPASYRGDKYWKLFQKLGVEEGRVLMTTALRTWQFVSGKLNVAIFLQPIIQPWDWAGEKVIIEELGFKHTYLNGMPTRFDEPPPAGNRGYLLCPEPYHQQLIQMLDRLV